jgi:ribose transport system permease protein
MAKTASTEAEFARLDNEDDLFVRETTSLVGRIARGRLSDFWIVGVLATIVIGFGIAQPAFLTQASWIATSTYAVTFVIIGIGQTFVIISGGIDLSVGAIFGFAAMTGAVTMRELLSAGLPPIPVMVIGATAAILVGAILGLVNGVLITVAKLPPFIATLASLSAVTGGTLLLSGGVVVSEIPAEVGRIGSTMVAGWLPVTVIIAILLAVTAGWFLQRTRFGSRTFAIGSNEAAAERTGIPVRKHIMTVYALSGIFAGIAGALYLARFSSASPIGGQGIELAAIAAVVIGGASLAGGKGSVLGAVVGALIMSVLVTGLIVLNVPTFWQQVAVGVLLAAAVYADQLRVRLAAK